FSTPPPSPALYTPSLHDALPIFFPHFTLYTHRFVPIPESNGNDLVLFVDSFDKSDFSVVEAAVIPTVIANEHDLRTHFKRQLVVYWKRGFGKLVLDYGFQ